MANKTILITGATRGIGLTFVEHYVTNGWKVIAAARNLDKADKLRALSPYKIVQLDVADEESILMAAKQLDGEVIDVLINNAGVLCRETLESAAKADIMKQLEVNAVGPFLVTRAFREHLKRASAASGVAKVVSLSSFLGSITLNETGQFLAGAIYGYRSSKAALNMINKSLSIDLKDDRISTIVFHPGYVKTEMNGNEGVTTSSDSVAGMTKLIGAATLEDSGKFFGESGEILPW